MPFNGKWLKTVQSLNLTSRIVRLLKNVSSKKIIMVNLGTKILDGQTPTIAVSFKDGSALQYLLDLRLKSGLDVAEIRFDLFDDCRAACLRAEAKLFKQAQLPTILTIRPKNEGGQWLGDEKVRAELMLGAIDVVDAIDIELSTLTGRSAVGFKRVMQTINKHQKTCIVSYHDFEKTPAKKTLTETINQMAEKGADLIKIACQINTSEDLVVLTHLLLDNPDKNLIVIGMGELGLLTRLSFPAYGSLLTFAQCNNMATAPGQIPLNDMVEQLRLIYPSYEQRLIKAAQTIKAI